jgi:hypothetical protein
MVIKSLQEGENLSLKDIRIIYMHLADSHLYVLKLQSKCEFFYWNSVGFFALLSFILCSFDLVSSPSIGIVVVGIGTLLACAKNMRLDFEYGVQAAACVERGVKLENTYDRLGRLFRTFESNKFLSYRGNLLSRLFPLDLLFLMTSISGIISAINVSTWLAVIVALFSTMVLLVGTYLYIKTSRRIILGLGD